MMRAKLVKKQGITICGDKKHIKTLKRTGLAVGMSQINRKFAKIYRPYIHLTEEEK